ncbi:MAG: nucleotidyltransferase domain-containing protein [Bacteroidales bacterium]|nr:nucleotidyltransferase domain-containing protein [Bacteroidales bacterium]
MSLTDKNIEKLRKELKKNFPCIAYAYLFGSVAQGKEKENSDFDLAVFLKPPDRNPELVAKIIGLVESVVSGFTCDLLILNDTGSILSMEVLKGKLLFVRESALDDYAAFYSLTCRKFEDELARMKKQLKYRGHEVQWDY